MFAIDSFEKSYIVTDIGGRLSLDMDVVVDR